MSTASPLRLSDFHRCFQGVIPSIFATCDAQGIPNVTYVSQVHLIDKNHVALSRQFFNKTSRNLEQTGLASAELLDPVTLEAYRLKLRFLRTERSGPLFDRMALRIEAIASVTGMSGVFRLIGADVFEVLHAERVVGFLTGEPADLGEEISVDGLRTEVRGLQLMSDRIRRAVDLESLFEAVLQSLEEYFGFRHAMILLAEEHCGKLITMASRGYGESGVGAEVAFGEGLIGTVARERRVLRMSALDESLRYGRSVRREVLSHRGGQEVSPEIPLPGLPDAQSILVIPLAVGDRLAGVLAAESHDPMRFGEWHEAYLEIIGNQIALGIERMANRPAEEDAGEAGETPKGPAKPAPQHAAPKHTLTYYAADDSVFADGDYLIRNVPGRLLWKLLREWRERGRTEFTNRELRLDPSLGLPEVKDNLESRLILLRRRLAEKCPAIRMTSSGRGRFALEIDAELELVEK